jgi:hypothetical protein
LGTFIPSKEVLKDEREMMILFKSTIVSYLYEIDLLLSLLLLAGFSLSIRLIDQSNFHPKDFNLARVGVSVNCFSPRYEEWLPRVSEGSVIALHAMKVRNFSYHFP